MQVQVQVQERMLQKAACLARSTMCGRHAHKCNAQTQQAGERNANARPDTASKVSLNF